MKKGFKIEGSFYAQKGFIDYQKVSSIERTVLKVSKNLSIHCIVESVKQKEILTKGSYVSVKFMNSFFFLRNRQKRISSVNTRSIRKYFSY